VLGGIGRPGPRSNSGARRQVLDFIAVGTLRWHDTARPTHTVWRAAIKASGKESADGVSKERRSLAGNVALCGTRAAHESRCGSDVQWVARRTATTPQHGRVPRKDAAIERDGAGRLRHRSELRSEDRVERGAHADPEPSRSPPHGGGEEQRRAHTGCL